MDRRVTNEQLDAIRRYAGGLREESVDSLNTTRRTLAYIMVDTSGSLRGYEEVMERAVADLYQTILNNGDAAQSVELGVETFDSNVTILQPPCEILRQEAAGRNFNFECEGATYTGLALQVALEQIDQRLNKYNAQTPRIQCNAPVLFLLTDGRPECYDDEVRPYEDQAMTDSLREIQNRVRANQLSVIAVEIGENCDHALLRQLTGLADDRHVYRVSERSRLSEAFQFTSSLIIHASQSRRRNLNETDIRGGVGR